MKASDQAVAVKGAKRGRGRPTLEDVAQIEEHLLGAALKEFIAKGYGGVSMSQIVKAAHVSKTTLYSRYPSKEELFRAIMRQQVERLGAATTLASSGGSPDLLQGLKSYANRTLAISLEGELLAVNRLVYAESHRFPELGKAASERTELGIAQVAGFIERCVAASGIRCPAPQTCAEAFIYMLRGWYVDVMLANRKVSAAERAAWVDRVVPAFLAGIGGL